MTSADFSHKLPGYLLAMGGPEDRLQLVLGKPDQDGYTLLSAREWTVPGESVRFLTPGLKEMLDSFELTMQDIDNIACVRGPGSFTGLRLVIATAEGLAAGCNARLAGIDYLHLLASGPAKILNGILHVLTYARRGLVYFQSFNVPSLKEAHPLASLSLEEATKQIVSMSDTANIMGSALRKNREFFNEFQKNNQGYMLFPKLWDNASPEQLLAAAQTADYGSPSIEPVYVRASDAEDNLPTIAQKRGLDPEKARQRLAELQKR